MGDQQDSVAVEEVSAPYSMVAYESIAAAPVETSDDVSKFLPADQHEHQLHHEIQNQTENQIENGNVALVEENTVDQQPQPEEPSVPPTEEDRLWSIVTENPADFNAWTSLIQETEKTENLVKICKVYDAFLAEFPLCYGYWKKYADHEARLGSADKIVEVYEQAVQAVTYSVDIWMHYCTFAMSKFEDPDDTRRLFERGLSYVQMDYLSHLLWDKYIEFEYSLQEWGRLAQIYTRILQIPIQQLDRYYNSFKQLATSQPLAELQTAEEISASAALASAAAVMDAVGEGGEGIPVDQESLKPEGDGTSEAQELEKYLAAREAMYKKSKEFDAKIREFEMAIRRPYFHVKPLDDIQLGNWHRYLEFIEREGDFDRIVKMYERCLIACANYPEYWIHYVLFLESSGNMELASDAVARATCVFVKRRPEIHIFAARFKEQLGDIVGARAEYQLLSGQLAPGLIEAVVKHANMEKRQGNDEGAISVYETSIEAEKGKEESRALPLLFIQYSRFLDQVVGNADKAREVLVQSLELLPHSKALLVAAIHFESIRTGSKQIDYLDSVVEHATAPKPDGFQGLSPAEREEISSIFVEFVDVFGDIHAIKKAEGRHKRLFPPRKTSTESKKRPSDSSASDRAKVAKPNTAAASAVSPAQSIPAYANGQSQWGAGYGAQGYVQPQNWQQTLPQQAPVQPQQWNPVYDQQAGYGAYGGYANYGPQQQQQQPPQQQGYGGYGQGYPPQAFPQQNYGQPAPAYPTSQQQPPAQQAYYAGYY